MRNPRLQSLLKNLRERWKKLLLLLFLATVGAGLWWLVYVPRLIEPLYRQAVEQYHAGDYPGAIGTLERAYALNSRDVRVNILLGWSHRRLEHLPQAEFYFARAHRSDPSSEEAELGLAFASLALHKLTMALPLLQGLALKQPDNEEVQTTLGQIYVEMGENLRAAETYRSMLRRDRDDQVAQRELLALYGYAKYHPKLQWTLAERPRPAQTEMYFRTRGDYFQALVGKEWKDVYLLGVNLGPARPGEFPSTASRDFWTYSDWLKEIAALNANTVRLYTLLPPAFYQALKTYNDAASSPLWLIQEVWLSEAAENLYEPGTEREFRQDLTDTIDVLHGRANMSYRRGHNYGIYTADVSRYVLAVGVGREVEPRLAWLTNTKNPSQTTYRGRYISVEGGNPTETWFARMCDVAASYEADRYNAQRPLTVVNWPPLDPLTHPTEATYAEEMKIRKKLGETVDEVPPAVPNDSDIASTDITKFKTEAQFEAGLFALYHVYQHWPDFLLHEPSYALARDAQGPNRYLGYLRELKKVHKNFPLLIGEYGVATSLTPAHLHPQGWNNGGLTEKQQAELLVRFSENIWETRCAGGVVFEWQDEWFKHVHDMNTADFELPWDRNPLWMNVLDPEKSFGLVGYKPVVPVPLLRGERMDWQRAELLSSSQEPSEGGGGSPGELRAMYAMSDFDYLYLRLDVESNSPLDWKTRNYWIALNTLPAESGSRSLPGIPVRLDTGANFLIQLTGPSSSRILIAENYNPSKRVAIAGRPGVTRLWRKLGMKVDLEDSVPFEEMITEVNQPRFARDGTIFAALDYNRSRLPYGTADDTSPEYSSHALWHVDARQGMIELRLPWGLLMMMDPSDLQAFAGTDPKLYTSVPGAWLPVSKTTSGASVVAFALRVGRLDGRESWQVSSSVPPLSQGQRVGSPPVYAWGKWNQVRFRPYFKRSYFALQQVFGKMVRTPPRPPAK